MAQAPAPGWLRQWALSPIGSRPVPFRVQVLERATGLQGSHLSGRAHRALGPRTQRRILSGLESLKVIILAAASDMDTFPYVSARRDSQPFSVLSKVSALRRELRPWLCLCTHSRHQRGRERCREKLPFLLEPMCV